MTDQPSVGWIVRQFIYYPKPIRGFVPPKRWGELRSSSALPAPAPFVKWVGGKGPLILELGHHFPEFSDDQTYFEPFLGGGAVFLSLHPHHAVLSDLNAPLIGSYIAVRDHANALISLLAGMPPPLRESEYYERRDRFNRLLKVLDSLSTGERLELAALFIWLNHTCFNGLYRVNKEGLFNAALGDNPDPTIYSEINLRAVRRALLSAHAELACLDYEKALRSAVRGDVIYLDPPYRSGVANGGFSRYTPSGFDDAEQERLSRVVHDLVDRGCRVVLSNAHTKKAVALYKDLKRRIVFAPRKINCDGSGRGRVEELLVTG